MVSVRRPISHSQIVMLQILLILLGWALGIASALLIEHLKSRKRLRAIARSLDAEVFRLTTELFFTDDEFVHIRFPDEAGAPFKVHPWIERVVLDSVEIDPHLVTNFLKLDLELHNLSVITAKQNHLQAAQTSNHVEGELVTSKGSEVAYWKAASQEIRERIKFELNEISRRIQPAAGRGPLLSGILFKIK